MKTLERYLISFLAGFLIGSLVAMSMKYPLEVDSISKYKAYCPGSNIEVVRVGLSGDIYKIKCADGHEAQIH